MRYAKPGAVGGKLIREVISFCRKSGLELPFDSHILIATSGGSDSVALAHLLAQYGRRFVAPSQITLLHINHGWRGKESRADEVFVRRLAQTLKVGFIAKRLDPKKIKAGESWEDHARRARKAIYQEEAERLDARVLSAHQADDVAETLLWRLFTGASQTHGGGILFQDGPEIRPFLSIRKQLLKEYLREENQDWREDRTNLEGRFLRSKMRRNILPAVEELFPRAISHLVDLALRAQQQARDEVRAQALDGQPERPLEDRPLFNLFEAAGLKLRKPHLERLSGVERLQGAEWRGELHLPGGWRLKKPTKKSWILEKL